jgi:ABC-2 type transport system ATP-binding protein
MDNHDYEKETGLRNSIKNLVARKTLVRHAVQDISFEIRAGEAVAFLGPNGAGKTTTLKMLSGIFHPSSGHAEVLGFIPWQRKKAFKLKFAIVLGQAVNSHHLQDPCAKVIRKV